VTGIATALAALAAIAVVGWVLGRYRLLGENAAPVLARVTFTVAIPALLVVTVAHADLHLLFSRVAVVTAGATTVVVVVAVVVLRGLWRLPVGEAVVATLAASYLNAAHLGIPIAVYLVGDPVAVVPTLLFQQLVLGPIAFALLDRAPVSAPVGPGAGIADDAAPPAHGVRVSAVLGRTVRNPVIVASLTGLLLAALPWDLPDVVFEPFRVLGAAAAPMALVAFGMSLAIGRPEHQPWFSRELGLVAVLRAVAHPSLAYALGRALGLEGTELLAVVTMASLPTAQNVLVYALQYGRGQALARDAGVVTTLLAIPVLVLVAATLA